MNCLLVEQEELHMAEVSSRLSRAVPVCQVVTVQVLTLTLRSQHDHICYHHGKIFNCFSSILILYLI